VDTRLIEVHLPAFPLKFAARPHFRFWLIFGFLTSNSKLVWHRDFSHCYFFLVLRLYEAPCPCGWPFWDLPFTSNLCQVFAMRPSPWFIPHWSLTEWRSQDKMLVFFSLTAIFLCSSYFNAGAFVRKGPRPPLPTTASGGPVERRSFCIDYSSTSSPFLNSPVQTFDPFLRHFFLFGSTLFETHIFTTIPSFSRFTPFPPGPNPLTMTNAFFPRTSHVTAPLVRTSAVSVWRCPMLPPPPDLPPAFPPLNQKRL